MRCPLSMTLIITRAIYTQGKNVYIELGKGACVELWEGGFVRCPLFVTQIIISTIVSEGKYVYTELGGTGTFRPVGERSS